MVIAAVVTWKTRPLWSRAAPPAAFSAPAATETPAPPKTDIVLPLPPAQPIAGVAVKFTVTSRCWVRIVADGQTVVNGELPGGERREVTAAREMSIDVGNAGAFEWEVNGQPAKPLATSAVRRTAKITPDTVKDFVR